MATARRAPDSDLLSAFTRGDRDALGALAERYEARLLGLARGLLNGDEAGACDAVQVMWVNVIRSAAAFEGRSSVMTWLYRILINACRTQQRNSKPLPHESPDHDMDVAVDRDGDSTVTDVEAVRAGVARLDAQMRETILLCHHRGLSREQAAEVVGVPVGTLKTRLRQAKAELRSLLVSTEVV